MIGYLSGSELQTLLPPSELGNPLGNTGETLRFVLSNNHQGFLWLPSRRRRPPLFSSDATINGCCIGVGHEYLGFNRQYLAALILNLNVFYTLPIWQSGVNILGLTPQAALKQHCQCQCELCQPEICVLSESPGMLAGLIPAILSTPLCLLPQYCLASLQGHACRKG
jgi:hypothetical protein